MKQVATYKLVVKDITRDKKNLPFLDANLRTTSVLPDIICGINYFFYFQ
jgi:hypothetical protein